MTARLVDPSVSPDLTRTCRHSTALMSTESRRAIERLARHACRTGRHRA